MLGALPLVNSFAAEDGSEGVKACRESGKVGETLGGIFMEAGQDSHPKLILSTRTDYIIGKPCAK